MMMNSQDVATPTSKHGNGRIVTTIRPTTTTAAAAAAATRNSARRGGGGGGRWYYFSVICGAAFFSAWSVLRFTVVAQQIIFNTNDEDQRQQQQQQQPMVVQQQQQQQGVNGQPHLDPKMSARRQNALERMRKIQQHYQRSNNNNNNKRKGDGGGPVYELAKVTSKIDTLFEKTYSVGGVEVTVGKQGGAVQRAIVHGMAQRNQGSHRSTWDRIENPTCLDDDTTTTDGGIINNNYKDEAHRRRRRLLTDTTTTTATNNATILPPSSERYSSSSFTTITSSTNSSSSILHRRLQRGASTQQQQQQQQKQKQPRRNPQSPTDFLPQAILIGVQKGGTTALYTYLDQHPDIAHSTKELYFLDETVDTYMTDRGIPKTKTQIAYGNVMKRAIRREKDFSSRDKDDQYPSSNNKMILDLTPNYLFYGDRLPQRIQCLVPTAKIFCLLRNPIDRARSQYDMKYQFFINSSHDNTTDNNTNRYGNKVPTFDEYIQNDIAALKETGVLQDWNVVDFNAFFDSPAATEAFRTYVNSGLNAPIGMGLYAMQLKPYYDDQEDFWLLDHNNDDNNNNNRFLAIPSEQLQHNTTQTYAKVLRFLGLPPLELSRFPQSNRARQKQAVVSPTTRALLQDVFRPFNKKLVEMLGGEWNHIEWV
jgi:hypothetical protein